MRRALALVALALLSACESALVELDDYLDSPSEPSRYAAAESADLVRARDGLERGDPAVARSILEGLAARRPQDVWLAVLAQEAAFGPASSEQRAQMIEQARSRALGTPTPVALILAARIEPDAAAARAFADQAVDVAPKEPWAFYARAFLAARAGDWTDAGADLDRTLELDPGHRPGRRLQARILARTGKPDQAIEALRVWIKASQDDARISAEERLDARLDLVQLHAELGNDQQALDALMGVVDTGGQSLRKLLLEAAVEQGLGRVDDALETARRARELHPERVEPLVHEALLRQHHFDPPRDPATAWREVLERARRSKGLGALVEELRARVVLERQGIFVP